MFRGTRRLREGRRSDSRARPLCLARDDSGNVLPLIAIGLLVMAALLGSGVDMARAYKAERRLQAACDAGVLAGRRAVTTHGFDTTVQAQANQYFNANFDDVQQQTTGTTFTPSSDDDGNTVVGTATTQLNTIIMKIFGFAQFDLATNCSASMGVGNSDIMFVLDMTDSMDDEPDGTSPETGEESKLQSLKGAMQDFYDTVDDSVSGSNARIRYGFVPYSSSVRVGHLLEADWLVNSMEVQSLQRVNWTAVTRTWTGTGYTEPTYGTWQEHSSTNYSQANCNTAKPSDTSWANYGSTSSETTTSVDPTTGEQVTAVGTHQPQRYTDYECRVYNRSTYRIYKRTVERKSSSYDYSARNQVPVNTHNANYASTVYQKRTFDTSSYKLYNSSTKSFTSVTIPFGTNSGRVRNTSYTWNGCIQERKTIAADAFTFVSLEDGITPAEALDLDIDSEPTSSDDTKWAPMWGGVTYKRETDVPFSSSGSQATSYCPPAARLMEEMDEATFDAYAIALDTSGYTYHDLGLIWGARLSSPSGIFADNVNEEPDNGGTVSRHLIFMTDGMLNAEAQLNTGYGVEFHDHRIGGAVTSDSGIEARHRLRFLAVCEAIKGRGIRLWVIAFGTALTGDLVTCATDGLASAFQADDSDELDEHFQEIAKQVGELRIVQ